MIEHRLIERMLDVIRCKVDQAAGRNAIDPCFVDAAVDFIRVYADRTHHGKEEDILFRDLRRKGLSAGDHTLMQELVEEHGYGRKMTKALVDANTRYHAGDQTALAGVLDSLKALGAFYPEHIKKEDDVFFVAAQGYLTRDEDQAMLTEFREFDRRMIHEKYQKMVKGFNAV